MKNKIALLLGLVPLLTSCGNLNIGLGNYTFNAVHISTYIKNVDIPIKSWKDDDTGIEVKTEDYGSIFLSEGTYILISDMGKCPICD